MSGAACTTHRLVARSALSVDEMGRMLELMRLHFAGVSAEQFARDMAEKNWALLIERDGRLVGFTTILAYETQVDGERVSVIYSGDTIVSPEAWNTQTLPRAWIESVARLREDYPRGPYVWLLITSGFRTYRFLPLFWRAFYPHFDCATPPRWQRMMDHLAAERFGAGYHAGQGIVRLENPQPLREELARIPAGRADDRHVRFFLERNPGHGAGDELVCVTELTPENLTAAGRRMAGAVPRW